MRSPKELAKFIDNTLLKQDATETEIRALCAQSVAYDFKAVCVNSCWVKLCAEETAQSDVIVCSVVGFPLGSGIGASKAYEAKCAIDAGAREIDMVINVGALKSGFDDYVAKDVAAVVAACKGHAALKVILEMCLLTEAEKRKAVEISRDAGADFVKTSTGFSTGGATEEDIRLMHSIVGGKMGIKAAGGVRSFADAKKMIDAGATRIGTSNGVKIIEGLEVTSGY